MALREAAPTAGARVEPEARLTDRSTSTVRTLLLAIVGLASLAAAIHAWVVPEHMMELTEGNVPGWLPLAFCASAGVGVLYVLGIAAFGASRIWLAVGLVLHGLMASAGILSRTWGLPGAGAEGPTRAWIVATGAELTVAVLCAVLLTRLPAGLGRRNQATPGLALVGAAIVVAAGVGLLLVGAPEAIAHAQMLGTKDPWMWGGIQNGALLSPNAWMWGG